MPGQTEQMEEEPRPRKYLLDDPGEVVWMKKLLKRREQLVFI